MASKKFATAHWYPKPIQFFRFSGFQYGSSSMSGTGSGGGRSSKVFSYAMAPTLSEDKSWLAWGWAIGSIAGPRLGTILVDLENKEFRVLRRVSTMELENGMQLPISSWWHVVQWIK